MADFQYVLVPNKISTLFDRIRTVNRPAKVTQGWLLSNGFTSKNDRALIGLLKSLDYIDASGTPTAAYGDLKSSEDLRRNSIGRQMAVGYKVIFDHFPTDHIATSLTRDELANFIRPKVSAGASVVKNVVSTFFALKALAKFDDAATASLAAPALPAAVTRPTTKAPSSSPAGAETLNVTINLSLEIPPTSDADVYDKLFAAMAKHLRGLLGRDS